MTDERRTNLVDRYFGRAGNPLTRGFASSNFFVPDADRENAGNPQNSVLALVVSFNNGEELERTVKALIYQVEKLIILDNGSDSRTLECISELEAKYGAIPHCFSNNLGIGAALNQGLEIASKEGFHWVLTMDQDSIASSSMVSNLLATATKVGDSCIISSSLENKVTRDKAVKSAITSGNLVPMSIFNAIGKYNEAYFIDSVDFEFNLRVRNAGYKIIQSGSALLQHKLGKKLPINIFNLSFFYTLHAPVRRYYMYRNHVLLLYKFALTNPLFLAKKSIAGIIALAGIMLFDPEKAANLKMIARGITDAVNGKVGIFRA